VALKDNKFSLSLRNADWLVPDGIGIVLALRLFGVQIRGRVTGSDVFLGLHSRMNSVGGMSVFFLGAAESTLALMRDRMALDYPNIRIAGTYSPPFTDTYTQLELYDIIESVNQANADVLWVGMTAPKQERWIYENRHSLNVKFAGAIGAVFDFYTGRVKRSHPLFRGLGLEWLPRLVRQPRRLWRRTFISSPIFILHVIKARFKLFMQNGFDG
jgi:N-acetylglucosaminyldiphosphoundecaprenol N-acetyl-beta-D-mannosaminyltransferase